MPACTRNCIQGRRCTCVARPAATASPSLRTIPTRPSLWQRLRRWWQHGKLRAELAGLDREEAELRGRISDLEALSFASPRVAQEARMQLQLHRIGLARVLERRAALQQQGVRA